MAFTPNPETARLYALGLNLVEVGHQLGMNDRTVSRHLAALGVKTRRGRIGAVNRTVGIDWDQVERDHRAGDSTIVLESRYGAHRSTINRRLAKRQANRSREEARAARHVRNQRPAGDINALAADLAMAPETVTLLLHKHGFTTT